MTVGQVAVITALFAIMYRAPQMDCMVYKESSYRAQAVNGPHRGAAQFRHPEQGESIWDLLAGMAVRDPGFMHGPYVREHWDPHDPIAALAVMGWAIQNGYGEWWSTWEMCNVR